MEGVCTAGTPRSLTIEFAFGSVVDRVGLSRDVFVTVHL